MSVRNFLGFALSAGIALGSCGGTTEPGGSTSGGSGGAAGASGTGASSGASGTSGGASGASGQAGFGGGCWPSDPSCSLPGQKGFACLSLQDNSTRPQWTFRMSQLQLVKPDVLAGEFLQNSLITKNVTLDRPSCFLEGNGRLNWLLTFDPSASTLALGCAFPVPDPTLGYCYANEVVEGLEVAPQTAAVQIEHDGGATTFATVNPITTFNVMICLSPECTAPIMIPLHQLRVTGGRISSDHSCVGAWLGDELSPENNCKPDHATQGMQWADGGSLHAYISVEEADDVWIAEMAQTLCVALSGSGTTYGEEFDDGVHVGKRCKRDGTGRILAGEVADWCSGTDLACSPPEADAWSFQAGFAASGVLIEETCE